MTISKERSRKSGSFMGTETGRDRNRDATSIDANPSLGHRGQKPGRG
jgi:hypothetical protein